MSSQMSLEMAVVRMVLAISYPYDLMDHAAIVTRKIAKEPCCRAWIGEQ